MGVVVPILGLNDGLFIFVIIMNITKVITSTYGTSDTKLAFIIYKCERHFSERMLLQ